MGIGGMVGKKVVAPRIQKMAPNATQGFVREALDKAIHGLGPLSPATVTAAKRLEEEDGDVAAAVREVVQQHVRYAAAEGFLTNIGGLVTAAVMIPANVTGLAVIQCRMLAAIAHLYGHDLDDPRVRSAILVCLLDEDDIPKMVKKKKIPAAPGVLAAMASSDPLLEKQVSIEVAAELIARATGKRIATMVGRRMPIIGGVVGLTADAWATWQVGKFATRELAKA